MKQSISFSTLIIAVSAILFQRSCLTKINTASAQMPAIQTSYKIETPNKISSGSPVAKSYSATYLFDENEAVFNAHHNRPEYKILKENSYPTYLSQPKNFPSKIFVTYN